MGIMEKISDVLNQTEVKKNGLRRAMLTLLLEWNDLENHLELTQKCFQESYDELNSRENYLNAVKESVTQSSNELETIRKTLEKRFQEFEEKENEFHLFQKNGIREMEFKDKKLGLIRKEVRLREERMLDQEKLIEKHLEEIEMERERFEGMRKLVDEGVKEMSLKQKCVEYSLGGHGLMEERVKEIELKEMKLKAMEEELELREKRLNSIHETHSQMAGTSEENVEHTRKVIEASGSDQSSGDGRPPSEALEHFTDAGEMVKTNEKHDKNIDSAGGSNEAMPYVDAGEPRESGEQRNKGKKRGREQVEESRERCDTSSDYASKNKKREGCSYIEGGIPQMGENQQAAGSIGTTADIIEIDDDSDSDMAVEDEPEPVVYDFPEPEFNDFDKDKEESCFAVDQIWALYDDVDGMPRFYARIKKVFKPEFKLRITWLEGIPEDQAGLDWMNRKLPFGCGRFGSGHQDDISDRLTFSHQMHRGKGKSRASFMIYPRKGEVWALFNDWDIKWSSDSKIPTKYKYEIAEIVSDFVKDAGIGVVYLDKVKGFISLFQRTNPSEMDSLLIPVTELLRFSHRIPSFKMSGTEKEGVPAGSFELDPASLPTNPNDICYCRRVKEERQSQDAEIGSCSNVNVSYPRRSPRGLMII